MITADCDRLDLRPGMRVLDIGCGSGRHACEVFRCEGISVFGADREVRELREARKRLELHQAWGEHGGGRWALSAADVTRLPFRPECFHRIICSEMLEHVPDQERAMGELYRVLRPGGRMAVSVPRWWPERICWKLWAGYGNSDGGHIRIYRKSELIAGLLTAGLQRTGHHYAHALHSPYWWLDCWFRRTGRGETALSLYRRFLEWTILQKPRWVGRVERVLDPLLGKSLVVYVHKKRTRFS